jgi:NodT family efflux transporter outer membrane factor (OMF) lipoprotein
METRGRKPAGAGRQCSWGRFGVAWLAVALSGCTVGPDFVRPEKPEMPRYTMAETPAVMTSGTGEATQRVRLGSRISAQWWELFRSPVLSGVVRRAIDDSPTIAAARATLAAAQESVAAARGGLFPQIDVAASIERRKTGGLQSSSAVSGARSNVSQVSTLYSLGPSVSYALDVFGATRRTVEQQRALAERQAYELAAAYLTLTGNAVTQAITIASLRAQIQATEDVVADDERNLTLVRQKFEAGKAAQTDVLTAQTQLASDRTGLPSLRQQLSSARHSLSILVGRAPAEWSAPDFDLKDLALPGEVPLSLPSELARQRPDILAAEAQLHADSAAIGVATAQLYPSITLSGSLSQESRDAGVLFNGASTLWSLAAGLTAPVFHGGTLQAQRRAAIDAYRASFATYRQTVLQGFQQVADSLQALAHDAELVAAERQVLESAEAALALQRLSYAAGKSDLLQLLDAQRAYQQARLGYARALAQRLQDTAQLFVALGGGWWQAGDDHSSPKSPQRGS